MSINIVSISGNVGRDPEVRSTKGGTSVLTFSVAVNERVKNGNEWTDYTNWVDVTVFGRRAESLGQILKKGMKVAVSGRLRYSSWDKDGQKRSKIEVIASDVDLMQRRDQQQAKQQQGYQQQYAPQPQQQMGYQQGYQQGYGDYYPEDQTF